MLQNPYDTSIDKPPICIFHLGFCIHEFSLNLYILPFHCGNAYSPRVYRFLLFPSFSLYGRNGSGGQSYGFPCCNIGEASELCNGSCCGSHFTVYITMVASVLHMVFNSIFLCFFVYLYGNPFALKSVLFNVSRFLFVKLFHLLLL